MVAGLMDDPATREATDAMVPMPLGGHLQASQVAALLAWLTSEENSGVCGQTVYIDGGSDVMLRGDDVWGWNDPVGAAIAAG
jgi:enoyl-[acyl-carrier-protein] reductase (NADH)